MDHSHRTAGCERRHRLQRTMQFLSPSSSDALEDVIGYFCKQKLKTLIITTFSYLMSRHTGKKFIVNSTIMRLAIAYDFIRTIIGIRLKQECSQERSA